MSFFRPARVSPPLKSTQITRAPPRAPSLDTASVLSGSTIVIPELQNLTSEDIRFIDLVIQRAGPSATTFPIVFKAYNAILKEQGMDSGEVRYYGKLLKLGTMKGKNWGEKWEEVKRQHRQASLLEDDTETVSSRVKPCLNTLLPTTKTNLPRLQDLHAATITSEEDEEDVSQYHKTKNVLSSVNNFAVKASPKPRTNDSRVSLVSSLRGLPPSLRNRPPGNETEISGSDGTLPSTTPPSYNAISHGSRRPYHHNATPIKPPRATKVTKMDDNVAAARKAIEMAKENRRRVVNDDDVWNNIRMQQLEEEADRYREDKLLERCWAVWKQGFEWIVMTNTQIDEVRRSHIIRQALFHWREFLRIRRETYAEAEKLNNDRRLRAALLTWRDKLKRRQQLKWQNDMRNKMKVIKDRQNLRILSDAWIAWQGMYQLQFASHHYDRRVLVLALNKWKNKLRQLDGLEEKAERFILAREQKLLFRSWRTWRGTAGLIDAEKELAQRVNTRLVWSTWLTWRKHAYDYRRANFFHDHCLQKRTLITWRNALKRIYALQTRADHYSARQDKVLVCAILRVWIARVRGREIERQRDTKLLLQAWLTWKEQKKLVSIREEHAIEFYNGTSKRVVQAAFSQWRETLKSHGNKQLAAVQYYHQKACHRFLSTWVVRYRERLEDKKRQKLVKKLQDRQAARVLYRWLLRTRQKRRCRQAAALMGERIELRIAREALTYWTSRVIDMRERELHAVELYHGRLEKTAWERWKLVYSRHKDNLKLLDDHIVLKQEDTLRRVFYRWLAAARVARHRRYVLGIKEEQIRSAVLQNAWEKWRSSFIEIKLRKKEYQILILTQKNLLRRAFDVWYAKTKTRPQIMAVKFYATRLRAKYYRKWKEAIPLAQQGRKARAKYDSAVLSRALNKWLEAYRTKLALKAVARARCLRLPAANVRTGLTPPTLRTPPSLPASSIQRLGKPFESPPNRPFPSRREGSSFPHRTEITISSSDVIGTMDHNEKETNMDPLDPDEDDQKVNNKLTPISGDRSRSSRLSRSPFGLGQGTGIVSLLRTNVRQQAQSGTSPPHRRYQFSSNLQSRASSPSRSDYKLFSGVSAESTPAVRISRSTKSEDMGGRRPLWTDVRRFKTSSPSVGSRITESPPSSP